MTMRKSSRTNVSYRHCENSIRSNDFSLIYSNESYDPVQIPSTSLLELAKQKRFDKIEEYLTKSNDSQVSSWIDGGSFPKAISMGLQAFKGETVLHLIMVYEPTVEVVDLLIRAMIRKEPQVVPEAVTDIQGRTPLTVAVINNCDISVIRRLLTGVTAVVPAVTKDSWQRLPLHWACGHSSIARTTNWSISCTDKSKGSDNMVRTIETLLKVYPYAAALKDVAGMTPFDIATKNRADPYVLQIVGFAWECQKKREDPSKASTESTSSSNIPLDEFKTDPLNFDFDDLSSIGSGGVSKYCRQSNPSKKANKTSDSRHETANL
jgi:hypothetical protein